MKALGNTGQTHTQALRAQSYSCYRSQRTVPAHSHTYCTLCQSVALSVRLAKTGTEDTEWLSVAS